MRKEIARKYSTFHLWTRSSSFLLTSIINVRWNTLNAQLSLAFWRILNAYLVSFQLKHNFTRYDITVKSILLNCNSWFILSTILCIKFGIISLKFIFKLIHKIKNYYRHLEFIFGKVYFSTELLGIGSNALMRDTKRWNEIRWTRF